MKRSGREGIWEGRESLKALLLFFKVYVSRFLINTCIWLVGFCATQEGEKKCEGSPFNFQSLGVNFLPIPASGLWAFVQCREASDILLLMSLGVTSSICTSSEDNHHSWPNLADKKNKGRFQGPPLMLLSSLPGYDLECIFWARTLWVIKANWYAVC